MNNNILNQLMQTKANRFGPAVDQANAGLTKGVDTFNQNNIFNRLLGSVAGPSGGNYVQGMQGAAQNQQSSGALGSLLPSMGGGSGGGNSSAAGMASKAGWAYLGMM